MRYGLVVLLLLVACSTSSNAGHRIGDTVDVSGGTVTVFSYANGVADVQQCGGHANPLFWRVREPNRQIAAADLGTIDGQLQTGELGPQDCMRGKIRFGYDAAAVEYAPPGGGVVEFRL